MSKEFVMLAHSYDESKHKDKIDGWWYSEKYDGVRFLWYNGNIYSRNENIYTIPEYIREQFEKIVDENGKPLELDGEMWCGYDTFAYCSGLARRDKITIEDWEPVKFIVFDIRDTKLKFEERLDKLRKAIKKHDLPNIKILKYKKFDASKDDIMKELEKIEKKGGEGVMLRKPGSLYSLKRSNDLLKVKSWYYKEGIVIAYVKGTGRLADKIGSVLVKSNEVNDDGKESVFRVGTGLNDHQRHLPVTKDISKSTQDKIDKERKEYFKKNLSPEELKKKQELIQKIHKSKGKDKHEAMVSLNKLSMEPPMIGSVITFKYKEVNKNGIPSMPVFVGVRDYE